MNMRKSCLKRVGQADVEQVAGECGTEEGEKVA